MSLQRVSAAGARDAIILASFSMVLPGLSRAETVYQYTGDFFNNVLGVYSSADRLTGQFTTDLPLAADLPFQDISGLVTSFSFNDGHQTLTQSDVGSMSVFEFMVSTDSAGQIADWRINLFGFPWLMQMKSESGDHNDAGQSDADNFGAIAGSRGTWSETLPGLPALGPPQRVVLVLLLLLIAVPAMRSRLPRT